MGNDLSPFDKARNIEKEILLNSGLILDENLFIDDVSIDYLGDNFIHTISCGKENKEPLVILHGYAAGSIFFFPTLKDLSKHFKVFCIDHLGMGLSSHPEFNCKNLAQTLEFFLESFERWRIKVGLNEKFIICGHSFGGYIASQYALKYPKLVKGLILLSPLGFTKDALEWSYLESDFYVDNLPFFQRIFHRSRLNFFKEKETVSDFANSKLAFFVKPLVKYFWKKRFNAISREISGLLWEFLQETFKIPNNSEKALHYIINPNFVAYEPIEGFVDEIKAPVTVMYGDNDWMCKKGAKRCNINNLNEEKFRLIIVEGCQHSMTLTNPKGLIEHFISKKEIIQNYFDNPNESFTK